MDNPAPLLAKGLAEVTRFCEAQIPLDMRHAVRLE